MNPALLQHYQELVDAIVPLPPNQWTTFRLNGDFDESGLGLSLEFISDEGIETQFSPVPPPIFRIVRKIRDAAGPALAWSEWIFDCDRDGQYNITVKYPES